MRGRDVEVEVEVDVVRAGVGRELRWGGGEVVVGGERAAAKRMLMVFSIAMSYQHSI